MKAILRVIRVEHGTTDIEPGYYVTAEVDGYAVEDAHGSQFIGRSKGIDPDKDRTLALAEARGFMSTYYPDAQIEIASPITKRTPEKAA